MPRLDGVALFAGLDSAIAGPLDDDFAIGDAQDACVARNSARPLDKLGRTSVFGFPVGGNAHSLDDSRAGAQGIAGKRAASDRRGCRPARASSPSRAGRTRTA
ncbi:MAG TPA: hypothetical protein PKB14_10075 [Rubrivivax sp.]|nr:hypothetical protein [Rubrivivax sp.]